MTSTHDVGSIGDVAESPMLTTSSMPPALLTSPTLPASPSFGGSGGNDDDVMRCDPTEMEVLSVGSDDWIILDEYIASDDDVQFRINSLATLKELRESTRVTWKIQELSKSRPHIKRYSLLKEQAEQMLKEEDAAVKNVLRTRKRKLTPDAKSNTEESAKTTTKKRRIEPVATSEEITEATTTTSPRRSPRLKDKGLHGTK